MNNNLLIIFLKNPELGNVKTRLARDIGAEKALAIYYKLINNTMNVSKNVDAHIAVCYSRYIDSEDNWQGFAKQKYLQTGDDIGERMFNALKRGSDSGYSKVGLIGADIYDLTAEILNEAFKKLEYYNWVFGPARDGGYYFAGCTNPDRRIFNLEQWSNDLVMKRTLTKANELGLKVGMLPTLNDIDTIDDIKGTELEKLLPRQ